ncbi:hypothetical protein FB45DRAFT_875820 [Roridomyces roridus]|uniref:BTB domain-containing protein n=1 Tax=Roridomyces roridus TaxID=1738132 RepID=A0AAD7B5E1_9AGAR|nr:hypothetical protein FB45DRAFT_875820 [Roridomyces roridus]
MTDRLRPVSKDFGSKTAASSSRPQTASSVSGSVLAARSPIFRDMLAIPQSEDQPTIGGCPIVVLPDSAKDLEYFLRAIFDSSFFEGPPKPSAQPILAGVLRLSTKYEIGFLRQRALQHLATVSPLTVEEFDKISSTRTFNGWPAQHLALADALDMKWSMPYTMYTISCSLTVDQLMSAASDVHLSPSVLRNVKHTFSFLRGPPSSGCASLDRCRPRRAEILSLLLDKEGISPMNSFPPFFWTGLFIKEFCASCHSEMRTQYEESRRRVWAELPEMFGLPSWEKLRAARDADLVGRD